MVSPKERPVEILLVEDSPGDVCLMEEAISEYSVPNTLSVVNDGLEAMAFLRRQGRHGAAPRPDLILLDLNLPRMDGREVLSHIKRDPELRSIPVVVLTTSKSEEDIAKVYSLHANCYLCKPIDFNDFSNVMHEIEQFWLGICSLPAIQEAR